MDENLQNEGGQMDLQDTQNIDANPTDTENNPADDNVNLDNTDTDNSGNDNIANVFDIPQEYKEKDWAKNFEGKTGDELQNAIFKALDEKYANTPVVPETVEGYALNEVEFKDENGNPYYEYPPEVLEHFGNEFKDLGVIDAEKKYYQLAIEETIIVSETIKKKERWKSLLFLSLSYSCAFNASKIKPSNSSANSGLSIITCLQASRP